ncbi:hypothetical protein BJ742DRAFT_900315 [Cladochytrium replicatum]|nr:hypothetical protein BJ742DRAFT_900315 [Cladochytrium replicatum]
MKLVARSLREVPTRSPQDLSLKSNEIVLVESETDDPAKCESVTTGHTGNVPKSSLAILGSVDPELLKPGSFKKVAIVTTLFNAKNDNELSVNMCDVCGVLGSDGEWTTVESLMVPSKGCTQTRGLVPSSYLFVFEPAKRKANLPALPPKIRPQIEARSPMKDFPSPSTPLSRGGSATSAFSADTVPSSHRGGEVQLDEIVDAKVTRFEARDKKFFFVVEVQCVKRNRIIYRTYDEFYQFHLKLMDAFPNEAGKTKASVRIIPYLPAPKMIVTESVTNKRRSQLNEYCQDLIKLHYGIKSHAVFNTFFQESPFDLDWNEWIEAGGTGPPKWADPVDSANPAPWSKRDHGIRKKTHGTAQGSSSTDNLLKSPSRMESFNSTGGSTMGSAVELIGHSITSENESVTAREQAPQNNEQLPQNRQILSNIVSSELRIEPKQLQPYILTSPGVGTPRTPVSGGGTLKLRLRNGEETLAFILPATIALEDLNKKVGAKLSMEGRSLYMQDDDGDLIVLDQDALELCVNNAIRTGTRMELVLK